jgi:kinetochore protein Spc7/SPC105
MADVLNKENLIPVSSDDPIQSKSPAKKGGRRGRSKSIGPGDLSSDGPKQDARQEAKNRRKSTYVPATKSIISNDQEKAERQAARRRTLANRRVSFAPEATLHTWDVIEFMRDPTTSTDSSDQTRRTSNITRSSSSSSPYKQSDDDGEPPSTPPEQEDEPAALPRSPGHQRDLHKKQRRASGIPPMDFNNPDDLGSSSGLSGSSDASGSEEEEEEYGSEDATGTAMSLDMGDETAQSLESGSSTSSSARLDAALRQAAAAAGTRGIEYDEHGDDDEMSMELAGDEITNAFKPWAQRAPNQPLGSAALDQENVNPFSPAFKAQLASGTVYRPETVEEEDTGDMSMDVTRAVGGIMRVQQVQAPEPEVSSTDDATMDLTEAVGKIHGTSGPASPATRPGLKRRRSTTEAGSPGASAPATQSKRRRSSVARSSMGDDTMELTMVMGGIQKTASPAKPERRRVSRRRSSGVQSELGEATMSFTQVVGGIKKNGVAQPEHTAFTFDENEELTMELTTVLGGIKAGEKVVEEASADSRPVTPHNPPSPAKANTTPKDQERYRDAPDSGPKKLLTPIFQKQVMRSAEKSASTSADRRRKTISPGKVSWTGAVFDEARSPQVPEQPIQAEGQDAKPEEPVVADVEEQIPVEEAVSYPQLPPAERTPSPMRRSPTKTPPSKRSGGTPRSAIQQQLDSQFHEPQPSPMIQKVLRSSPVKTASSPERPGSPQDTRKLADSIQLLSTPRKETLKSVTPKKAPAVAPSPAKAATPRSRPTPKAPCKTTTSPWRKLSDDLFRAQETDQAAQKIHLQAFLEQANIRFMDITATKRRLTTAPTPSKARKTSGSELSDPDLNLANAVVAAACTQPEHDMFQHACHELKHYISEGKKEIKQLEAETYEEMPPLIAAYTSAPAIRKSEFDAHMRDMKIHARLRSKEMWYAWRSQLLEDLMKALSGIGEGMIRDDDVLRQAEEVLDQVLPPLIEEHEALQAEEQKLQQAAVEHSDEEKEELEAARARIVEVDAELEEKRRMLEELQAEASEQEALANDLAERKVEFHAEIQEAERVREACRGISLKEIDALKGKPGLPAIICSCNITNALQIQSPP